MLAWLGATNHCALASDAFRAQAPEHQCCGEHESGGQHKSPLACCQGLQAPSAPFAKSPVSLDALSFVPTLYFVTVALLLPAPNLVAAAGDTGPPGVFSFAESILQRSILAHAPPLV